MGFIYIFSSAVPSSSGAFQMPTRPSSASVSSSASSAASERSHLDLCYLFRPISQKRCML